MPTIIYTDKEYLELLQKVDTKILALCVRERRITVKAVDVNGSMGVLQIDDVHDEDASTHSAIGTCKIGQEYHCGRIFWEFLEYNGLCSLLIFSKMDHGTWQNLRYEWHYNNHVYALRNVIVAHITNQ